MCECECVCVLECTAPSSKQERSTFNSITTLSPRTGRWPDQKNVNWGPVWTLSWNLFTVIFHTTLHFLRLPLKMPSTVQGTGKRHETIPVYPVSVLWHENRLNPTFKWLKTVLFCLLGERDSFLNTFSFLIWRQRYVCKKLGPRRVYCCVASPLLLITLCKRWDKVVK